MRNASGIEIKTAPKNDNEGPRYRDVQEPILIAMDSMKEFNFVNFDEEFNQFPLWVMTGG